MRAISVIDAVKVSPSWIEDEPVVGFWRHIAGADRTVRLVAGDAGDQPVAARERWWGSIGVDGRAGHSQRREGREMARMLLVAAVGQAEMASGLGQLWPLEPLLADIVGAGQQHDPLDLKCLADQRCRARTVRMAGEHDLVPSRAAVRCQKVDPAQAWLEPF